MAMGGHPHISAASEGGGLCKGRVMASARAAAMAALMGPAMPAATRAGVARVGEREV